MTVRRRVVVLTVACLVLVGLTVGVMVVGLWMSDHMARRVAGIYGRLDVVSQLSAKASSYSEQAAKVALPDGSRSDDLDAARIEIERLLARLTQATRAEIATLSGMEEVQSELPELENARRVVELYHSIDAAMNNVLSLQRSGQGDAARGVYERAVAFPLANELLPLLDHAAKDERDEIAAEIAGIGTAEGQLLIGAGAIGLLGLLSIVTLSIVLWRSISGPVRALDARTRALVEGKADMSTPSVTGEFAPLSESLAALATALAEQRQTFAEAGERLTSEVDARTAQLRTANEQLREIDRRRGQFLADVSHELRTPLTILRGEADVALRGTGDVATLRQSLERIQGQALELGQLLEDLIEFARSTAEDQPFVMADTSLDEVVAAAAQEATMLASPREVAVVVATGDGGRHIDADFRRLKQALLVGLDNAIKHSPPGTTVTVATAGDERSVRISIADEGPGVDEADLPHVFERFFRGRDQQDGLSSGLGIGLAIAKDIVERHGGTIGLSNRLEGGAVLSIELPAGERTA
ncbi:MAG TPA: HAMP domain-containing sensor histidine kinase [Devosia sp.]|nr:HAMP domain-containing sensor histidine kinase [Devosia sp.]